MTPPKIEWRSEEERLACFDALIVLATRGVIPVVAYHQSMEMIMGRGVFLHELGTTGVANLRVELLGQPSKDPFEVLNE